MATPILRRLTLMSDTLRRVIRHSGGLAGSLAKVVRIVRAEGHTGVTRRFGILLRLTTHNTDYAEWVRRFDMPRPESLGAMKAAIAAMTAPPVISIIMPVYDPAPPHLDAAIKSVRAQLYPHWELCIADDASKNPVVRQLIQQHASEDQRIKFVFRPENGHISAASNSALTLATGRYIGLFDHDDLLPPHALFHVAAAIQRHPDAGLIYSDEDKIDDRGRRSEPHFKPDWNPEFLRSLNYISHFGVYRTELVRALGGFRVGFEGAQDYDLALRVTEKLIPRDIIHIPHVLYHWRIHAGSTAGAPDVKPWAINAGERALREHLARRSLPGSVTHIGHGYRTRYELPSPRPLVSIIIPTRNRQDLVKVCIESISEKTLYRPYEIILADNGSDDEEAIRYFEALAEAGTIRIVRFDGPFNFPAINNKAVVHAEGSVVCLLNNDTEIVSPDWLGEMVSFAVQEEIGAVGARLWYPDMSLQHAGVITGLRGLAAHAYSHFPADAIGYFGRAALVQNLSAVTAACLTVRKSLYLEVGGLSADLGVAFNDVDFCLRLRTRGFRNVWTPFAELYHHESLSRGYEETAEKWARFRSEAEIMLDRWGDSLIRDPAYNPNLTLGQCDFSFAWPPRVRGYDV